MTRRGLGILVVASLAVESAYGAECVGLAKIQVTPSVTSSLSAHGSNLASCSSLSTVLGKITRQKKTGGRQLEKDRPVTAAEAETNLAKAMQSPAVRERLARVANSVEDPTARLVYEAAVLDEEGFYAARDLKVQQVIQATP